MDNKDYLKDIGEIKNMMTRSSQFISLSGLSGVLAGVYALVGAYVARGILGRSTYSYDGADARVQPIVLIAFTVLALSVASAFVMTYFKARRHGEPIWNSTARRLIANFMIPLGAGGIFALFLLRDHHYQLIAPVTLIFYGLACVNASKYTLRDVRYLGLTMVILGLWCAAFQGYGLEFWAIGFGICHIVYGSIMYFRYDRKQVF